jgi:hypothetical protein
LTWLQWWIGGKWDHMRSLGVVTLSLRKPEAPRRCRNHTPSAHNFWWSLHYKWLAMLFVLQIVHLDVHWKSMGKVLVGRLKGRRRPFLQHIVLWKDHWLDNRNS